MFARRNRRADPIPHPGPGPFPPAVNGWAPYGAGQHASSQIGAFAGTPLSQYPANIPGVQLRNGRIGNNPGWYTPGPPFVVPVAGGQDAQRTQAEAGPLGGLRYGQRYTGGYGPVNVKRYQANIAAGQLRASGLSAFPWARGLAHRAGWTATDEEGR